MRGNSSGTVDGTSDNFAGRGLFSLAQVQCHHGLKIFRASSIRGLPIFLDNSEGVLSSISLSSKRRARGNGCGTVKSPRKSTLIRLNYGAGIGAVRCVPILAYTLFTKRVANGLSANPVSASWPRLANKMLQQTALQPLTRAAAYPRAEKRARGGC